MASSAARSGTDANDLGNIREELDQLVSRIGLGHRGWPVVTSVVAAATAATSIVALRVWAVLVPALAVIDTILLDNHGIAALVGMLAGLLMLWPRRRRRSGSAQGGR